MNTIPIRFERRSGQRFTLNIPVNVQLAGSPHNACGFTQDLSARGAFFFTDYPLGVGEAVELTLVMPSEITLGEAMRVRCIGNVLRVVQPSVGTKLGVAVHFAGYEYLPESLSKKERSDFERVSALHPKSTEEEPVAASPAGRQDFS